jgi:hypothetical protein
MGVDTAPEHGRDKSGITIWDYQTMEQVWEFQGKLRVLDFIKVVEVGLRQYPGLVVVESNSYGNQVVEHLNASEFSIMLYKEKRGKNTFVPGLSTNPQTRPLMIDALYSYLTEFPEIVKSKRLALELTGLVSKKSGKVEADTGCTDDLALATACCMYVRKYDPPLLIDSSRYVGIANEMYSIINMNQPGDRVLFEDHSILKKVKDDNRIGFVDTFSIMRE